ncbi:hypothetical protein M5361_13535 [Ligilactobacillus agilis]|nr:hypothetical protein [Ligilactobacillus agilis]
MGKLIIVKFVKSKKVNNQMKIWLNKKEYTFFAPTVLADKLAVGQLQFVKTGPRLNSKKKNTLIQIQSIKDVDDTKRKMITFALKKSIVVDLSKPITQSGKQNVVKEAREELKSKHVWTLPKKEEK